MGLLGFKPAIFITLFGLLFFFAWGLGNGYVTWSKSTMACYGGNHWYKAVDKQPWLSIGSLTLKYQPWTWGCDADHRYSKTMYEVVNGSLVPIDKTQSQ